MSGDCGSKGWLRDNAWFSCDHCNDADEPSVHRAAKLKMWHGKTVCEDCWGNFDDDFPDVWTYMDKFEPFACLEKINQGG